MIYLDSNATSQIAPEVLDAMLPWLRDHFHNPSSAYSQAAPVKKTIASARQSIAKLINADPSEIIFTSCGTESDNTAIASAIATRPDRKHIVTTRAEHSAVLEPIAKLESEGYDVTWLEVDSQGQINLDHLRAAVDPNRTALVSIIWANNETGVLAPIDQAVTIAHEAGALLHTDAVQAIGKIPIDVQTVPIDFLAMSGHKFHAPKGIGVLYLSKRIRFQNLLLGGSQESGRRAGTENVAAIAAIGKAADLMTAHHENHPTDPIRTLRDHFENTLLEKVPGAEINGHPQHRLPTTSNLHFPGIDAAGLLILLDEANILCSAGSACHAGAVNPSHVLTAMGFDPKRAASSLRFSFSRYNTREEIDETIPKILTAIDRLNSLRPPTGPVITNT